MSSTLLFLALALGANEPEVLWFTSANCPHCKTAAPTMDRLAEMGLKVTKVDVDARRDVAQQFNITALPTTVMLRGGREADRIVGPASFDKLVQMLDGGSTSTASAPNMSAANSAGGADQDIHRRAMAAAVRLRVEDKGGAGVGTGTLIDQHGEEALIMTCGHIFREGQGKGKITVEFFAPGNRGPVPGQVIDFDLKHDVALVACRPGFAIEPAPVAGPEHRTQVGDAVFTIGCNKGADATVLVSKITSVEKYHGHPNVTAKGAPVIGRSGGGLFTADGRLLGVCNAADTDADEGVYASLPAVHGQLDKINQARIYKRGPATNVLVSAAPPMPEDSRLGNLGAPPRFADRMPPSPGAVSPASFEGQLPPIPASALIKPEASSAAPLVPNVPVPPLSPAGEELDVMVVVRPKNNPQAPPQVFMLNQLPAELRQRMQDPRIATRPQDVIIRGQN